MKKNTVIYLIVFVILAITATILWLKKTETTLPQSLTNFAVDDTAGITTLHLTDHFKNDITLQRVGGHWMVDNKYVVKKTEIDVLLETIKEVKVKNPVPLPARNNVIKDLAVNGIKIDISGANGLIKTYYVGSSTANDEGTYMILQGSSEPFVTHIPGFVGYLTTRYITAEQVWRSSDIYHLNPVDITDIRVHYFSMPEQSFILKTRGFEYQVYKEDTTQAPAAVNQLLAKKYLVGYRGINFEQFAKLTSREHDSVLKSKPYASISVSASGKKMPTLTIYPIFGVPRTDTEGHTYPSLDRFYATIGENNKELVIMQATLAGKMLITYGELANGKGVLSAR